MSPLTIVAHSRLNYFQLYSKAMNVCGTANAAMVGGLVRSLELLPARGMYHCEPFNVTLINQASKPQ